MTTIHDVTELATNHGIQVPGIVSRDDGASCVLFIYSPDESSAIYFSTGFLQSEQQAVDFAYGLMQESMEDLMNILKNDKLFPNIRGVMLKDKPVTLHMSGNVKITELQGGDARVELFFTDHKKTAVVNRNQALAIIDAYGPETDEWKGKPVVLFAEEGVWFGKRQWGLRVNADATKKAWSAEKNGNGKAAARQARLVSSHYEVVKGIVEGEGGVMPGKDAIGFDEYVWIKEVVENEGANMPTFYELTGREMPDPGEAIEQMSLVDPDGSGAYAD